MSSGSDGTGPITTDVGVDLESVSMYFRRYGDRSPSFKQAVLNRLLGRSFSDDKEFWIYRNLNLTVEHGQRLGVIGRNGAGKSTLLKMICGIYRPTTGVIRVRGRIAPMIELGAGFHPELSGRENIFLNGALLGFGPVEMKSKVESILDFAGVGDFAETPIKYYSTGMLLRLAFSIATDVDPEILIIDEVFAGGDVEFTERATRRMHDLMDSSHIVIMVSHSMDLIRDMCDRAIWLADGTIIQDGDPASVCEAYLKHELPRKA